MKKNVILFLCLILLINFTGCNLVDKDADKKRIKEEVMTNNTGQVAVKVTNYPLYFFTSKIAGNKLAVDNLLPPGAEPHGWEPSPRDLVGLENASLLIYNGAGFEDWIVDITHSLNNKELVIVDASTGVDLIKDDEDDHSHSDPHIWLDPKNSQKMVANILDALVEISPENKDYFNENAQVLIEQLDSLDQDYQKELANSPNKVFVVNHAAFGYLAKRYGLEQIAVMGINPHTEPTPQRIAQLVKLTKEHNLKYIFTETLVSSKVSETIAREVGINTMVLNPLGNLTVKDSEAGKDYFSIMYENLAALKEGLNN
ncbi:MAG: metal ABC transporter solute-binding protein, Zn/Mn family [Peptococcales bacterium]|jgi:zinc transport system substrate-binding protein